MLFKFRNEYILATPIINHLFMRKLSGFLILSIVFGCSRDKVDLDMLEDIALSPEVEVPLVNASLALKDVVEEDTIFDVHPDESISISYRNPELFTIEALDLVSLPDQAALELPLYTGVPTFELEADLGTLGGVELENAKFHKGYNLVSLQAPNPVSSDVKVKLSFSDATRQAQILEQTFTLRAGNGSATDTMLLSQAIFDFSDGNTSFNHFSIKAEIVDAGSLAAGEKLSITCQLMDLELASARGFFGQRAIKVPSGSYQLEMDFLRKFTDGLHFANPRLKIIATSTVGIGVGLSPDFKGVNNNGHVTALTPATYTLNPAADVNSPEELIIELNRDNSNIVDFLAAVPKDLLFSGIANLNPQGRSSNFIDRQSEVAVGLDINVPLEMSIRNMKLEEKLDVDFFSKNPDEVQSASLLFRSLNGFPVDLDISVAILDQDNGDSIHGFELPLLKSAEVDAAGKVIKPVNSGTVSVEITEEMLDALSRSDKLKLSARLNTPEDGQKVVKLFTDYFVDINIAAKAKMNIKP